MDNHQNQEGADPTLDPLLPGAGSAPQTEGPEAPMLNAQAAPAKPVPYAHLPEDLRVPWTWLDLLLFFFFAIGCLLVTARVFLLVAAVLVGVPRGADGGMAIPNSWQVLLQLIWFVVLLGYLYLLVRIRFKKPFWYTVGFRPMRSGGICGRLPPLSSFART